MTKFEESEWKNPESAREYVENSERYILERERLLNIMKSFYQHFLHDKNGKTEVLDLGCGDGRLTYELLSIDPEINATLVDGSLEMLKRAKNRLNKYSTKNLNFINKTFQALMTEKHLRDDFKLVVSSLAIHHLDMDEKDSLFNYIYDIMDNGGFFLNIDVILPPFEPLEQWYLSLWREWIIENETYNISGSFRDLPYQYKNNPDNRPDTLENQLKSLERSGFKNIDCYYKFGIFSIFGGEK
jgi:tRNA (cmo5U34)-methyltransferase